MSIRILSTAAALLLAGCSTPYGSSGRTSADGHASASLRAAPEHVRVEVVVDYGPAARPTLRGEIALPPGSTPIDAARALAEVEQGWLCCSDEDVWAIGGVGPDARHDRYWFWKVDGESGQVAPNAHALSDGERIDWVYAGNSSRAEPSAIAPAGSPRVLSLLPAATEIVFALGGDARLVGLSHLCPQPEQRELPRVVSTAIDSDGWDMPTIDRELREMGRRGEPFYTLDKARIAELAPTLVLSQGLCPVCAITPAYAEAALMDEHGRCPQMLVLSPRSLADVADTMREIGAAIGRLGAGRVAARAFELRIERATVPDDGAARPRVAVLEWFDPLWVSGEWIAEMVVRAGGEPVLAGPSDSSRRTTWEALAQADPDLIVLGACSMSIERTARELPLLLGHPIWPTLRAVRSGRVYLMDGEAHFSIAGPRLAEGLEHLRAILADPAAEPPQPGAWRRLAAP